MNIVNRTLSLFQTTADKVLKLLLQSEGQLLFFVLLTVLIWICWEQSDPLCVSTSLQQLLPEITYVISALELRITDWHLWEVCGEEGQILTILTTPTEGSLSWDLLTTAAGSLIWTVKILLALYWLSDHIKFMKAIFLFLTHPIKYHIAVKERGLKWLATHVDM